MCKVAMRVRHSAEAFSSFCRRQARGLELGVRDQSGSGTAHQGLTFSLPS